MLNNFTQQTRELFDFGGWSMDWETGSNRGNCIHHIFGRMSNSPYNAAPLNNRDSHQPEGRKGLLPIHCKEVRQKYFNKTKRYLDEIGYIPTEKDKEFLKYVKDYFNEKPQGNNTEEKGEG